MQWLAPLYCEACATKPSEDAPALFEWGAILVDLASRARVTMPTRMHNLRLQSETQFDHELKIDTDRIVEIHNGLKTHEVRSFDRDYQVDNVLYLRGFDRPTQQYTGASAFVRVTNITRPGTYGLPSDVGVMSIKLMGTTDENSVPAEQLSYSDPGTPSGSLTWVEWNGGDCPLPPKARVVVKTRAGQELEGEARFFRWLRLSNFPPDSDIVRYRNIAGT